MCRTAGRQSVCARARTHRYISVCIRGKEIRPAHREQVFDVFVQPHDAAQHVAVKTIQSLREFHQARAMRFRMVVIVSILPLVMVLAKRNGCPGTAVVCLSSAILLEQAPWEVSSL